MTDVMIPLVDPWAELLALPFLATLAAVLQAWRQHQHGTGGIGTDTIARALRKGLVRYSRFYDRIAGVHPNRRPWHLQWLSVKDMYRDLRPMLAAFEGQVLDVGCRGKPYGPWLTRVSQHVGVDVIPGPTVDHVIRDSEPWPLEAGRFQFILCTQVVQVVRNLPHLVSELDRVLAPEGTVVVTTPFCYNDMSTPYEGGVYKDYWRVTPHGLAELFSSRFDIVELRLQGGVGSTLGVMMLNWIHMSLSMHLATQILLALLFPAWLAFCLLVNMVGALLDSMDGTSAFYHNVLLVARKKHPASSC